MINKIQCTKKLIVNFLKKKVVTEDEVELVVVLAEDAVALVAQEVHSVALEVHSEEGKDFKAIFLQKSNENKIILFIIQDVAVQVVVASEVVIEAVVSEAHDEMSPKKESKISSQLNL